MAPSKKQPSKLSQLKISIDCTYGDLPCHPKVNRDKLQLINPLWKCNKGARLTIIQHTKHSTDLSVNNYIRIVWCQNNQKEEKNVYTELEKYKLGRIAARAVSITLVRQTYSFLEVKLRRLRRTYEEKYDNRDNNPSLSLKTVLILQLSQASQSKIQVTNLFTVNFIGFFPQKTNNWRLKTYLATEMTLNNIRTHGELQRCQTRPRNMGMTVEVMQTNDQKNCHSTV